ncbi:hypothetical protein FQN57_002143 [Myotisia sp. PD_48]|nr:hypothetical protein FQN57_002143 [Myotisia sp. PD_48]
MAESTFDQIGLGGTPIQKNNNCAPTDCSISSSPGWSADPTFLPVWAKSHVQFAENLLEVSDEPIEYYDDDEDYQDNCFFFPEDCVYYPAPDLSTKFDANIVDSDSELDLDCICATSTANMSPALPKIRMLDSSALADLLDDNLSPPEITSIFIFSTNGAIFAHASPLSQRKIRSLCATYGAAYLSYATKAPNGNLTGVNPSNHPSTFSSAPSVPLGEVGSIVFELNDLVSVVTKIADKVLLAVAGPPHLKASKPAKNSQPDSSSHPSSPSSQAKHIAGSLTTSDSEPGLKGVADASFSTALEDPRSSISDDPLTQHQQQQQQQQQHQLSSSAPNPSSFSSPTGRKALDAASISSHQRSEDQNTDDENDDDALRAQWEIDRRDDLDRLAKLNLDSSPSILLALESKSAALGRFLGNKLADLASPEDF